MPSSPSRTSSSAFKKKSTVQASTISKKKTPEPPEPPPVQVTSASIYSAAGHDDPQADDQVDFEASDNEDDGYPPLETEGDGDDAATTSLLPPPSFDPLFALITEPQSNITHHPSVYYVFSDDAENEREGHDVATIAALRALDQNPAGLRQGGERERDSGEEERYIILDLEPSIKDDSIGVQVKNISSLSPSWAITSANLRHAPTFEEGDRNGSLMLRIEGLELANPSSSNAASTAQGGKIKQDADRRANVLLQEARKRGGGSIVDGMGDLCAQLNKGLSVLDSITKDVQPENSSNK